MPHHQSCVATAGTVGLNMRTCRWCHRSYDADDPADRLWHRPGGCTNP